MGWEASVAFESTMRVLILSAIFACAAAAPSAPVVAIAPIIPAAIPTLSPGDLQAAAINAKVQAQDQARAIAEQARLAAEVARDQAELTLQGQKPIVYAAPSAPVIAIAAPNSGDQQAAAIDAKVQAEDQARALADQANLEADVARDQAILAAENQKKDAEEVTSIVKEKNEELFWNVEDKKWQAIDAVKTIDAKIDGAVARNAEAIAKSLTIPVVASLPYTNLAYAYYTPGLIPLVKDEKIIPTTNALYDICQTINQYRSLKIPVNAPLPYANLVYAPYTPGLTPYAIDPCTQFIRN